MNVEYRFPIFGDTVGGAVFADIGNVFAGSQIDFDNLRYGAGFGMRYLSPVGPLRIDIAAPLRAPVVRGPLAVLLHARLRVLISLEDA